MCALLAKLVRVEHVYATIFVGVPFFEKANKEVDAQFSKEEANLRKRIRYASSKLYFLFKIEINPPTQGSLGSMLENLLSTLIL